MACPPPSPSCRTIDDLPLFGEIDQPDFGLDFDALCQELFARPYQGLMRTSEGGYTDGSLFVYGNRNIKALVSHPDLGNQPLDVYTEPYRACSERQPPGLHELMQHNLFTMQPPHHGPARQLISRRLTSKSVARLASPMEALIEALIDQAAERDEVDFRRDITTPVMVGFWQLALGWSEDEATEACMLATRSQLSNLLRPTPDQRRTVNHASLDLIRLLERTLDRQLRAGTQELLNELTADYLAMETDSPGRPASLAAMLGGSLLDGLHSLGGVIANVVNALLRAPAALADVRADHSLVPAAVTEGVRLHPAVIFTQRHALRHVVIEGVRISEGTPVTMAWLLGNRDPAAFDDPNEYRLERSQRAQTTFGGGFYICPGRNLVRFLTQIVLTSITAPSVIIEPAGDARWIPGTGLHELCRMPVVVRRVGRPPRGRTHVQSAGGRPPSRRAPFRSSRDTGRDIRIHDRLPTRSRSEHEH